jgi:flavodoxin
MSDAIVIYNSRGGNTKKVALSIAEGLEVEAVHSKELPNLAEYDLLVLGTWMAGGKPCSAGKDYLSELANLDLSGKKAALFFTAGGVSSSPSDEHPNIVKTIKECFAEMEQILPDNIEILEDRLATKGAFRLFRFGPGLFSRGHPNEEDLQKARDFGKALKKYL